MQELINMYFSKLCSEKFFKNDDEIIIGKAKDVIQLLKDDIQFAIGDDNCYDDAERKLIITEANNLIKEINNTYSNKEDVIMLNNHPMAEFYVLQNKETLFKELKEYYDEMEEN